MTVPELIKKLQSMLKDNQLLEKTTVEIEYEGPDGCDTCGYGSKVTRDLTINKIYDLDTKLIFSVV